VYLYLMCFVLFVLCFFVLFRLRIIICLVCKDYCHRVTTQLQLVIRVIITALLVGGSQDRSLVTGDFFPGHQTVPCALGSTQPLKMSARIFLGVKTAGA